MGGRAFESSITAQRRPDLTFWAVGPPSAELTTSLELEKPLILVHEDDSTKGGAPLAELVAECPVALRHRVFRPAGTRDPRDDPIAVACDVPLAEGGGAVIVPWPRVEAYLYARSKRSIIPGPLLTLQLPCITAGIRSRACA